MEQTSQRELRAVDPDWTVSELMARIATTLRSNAPALSLSPTSVTSVPEAISLVVSTTGSTGKPKLVGLSSSALLASAKSSNEFLGATAGSTWSLLLPLNHIAGVNVLIRSLEVGTEPIDLRSALGPYPQVDFTAIVPTQLFSAINGDKDLLAHLRSAKAVLVGGAALSQSLRLQAESAGITIVTTYGSSETCGGCIYNGAPLSGVEVKIGADSRIAIKGAVLAQTYIGEEEIWNSQFSDGFFLTADLGHSADGEIVIDGRADDVIISGGENIALTSVDNILAKSFPTIATSAFAVNDPKWGQALHIALTSAELGPEEVSRILERELGTAAKPKGYLHLDELPLLGIGKVDRAKLTELYKLQGPGEASH